MRSVLCSRLRSTLAYDGASTKVTGSRTKRQATVTLLVVVFNLNLVVTSPNCPWGWFGEKCMYKCMCSNNQSCSQRPGCHGGEHCLHDLRSRKSYFGPGCQYVDVAVFQNNIYNSILVDHNDSNCILRRVANQDETIKIHIEPSPFMWFRLVFFIPTEEPVGPVSINFKITLNNVDQCVNVRWATADNITFDVQCDNDVYINEFKMEGNIVPYLCSVYISGGRNVALYQTAQQSSIYTNHLDHYSPSFAVDGLFIADYCAQTDPTSPSWWVLIYNHPQLLVQIIIYNRDVNKLQFFKLITYSRTNVQLDTFNGYKSGSPYKFPITSKQPVTWLNISLPAKEKIVFCEVVTLGETWCPTNTFGLWCQNSCSCTPQQSCHPTTGLCLNGCPQGWYGFKCLLECSAGCHDKFCSDRHGECIKCKEGYEGQFCDRDCPSGAYGTNCSRKCAKGCVDNVCESENGDCQCKKGFAGRRCEVCDSGFHGITCKDVCPEACLNQACNITGECQQCHEHFQGPMCDSCRPKWYNDDCYLPCPVNCVDDICDMTTGYCLACYAGKYGENCKLDCAETCNGTCDIQDGHCLSCKEGAEPPSCTAPVGSTEVLSLLYLVCIILIVPAVGVAYLFFRDKQKTEEPSTSVETADELDTLSHSEGTLTFNATTTTGYLDTEII